MLEQTHDQDMKERIQAILGVMGGYWDAVHNRILDLLAWGDIVEVKAPEGIEGLRAFADELRQRVDQLREQFLRELLIERRPVGTCVARFAVSAQKLFEETAQRLEQMGIVYSERVREVTIRALQEWPHEEGPFCPEVEAFRQKLTEEYLKEE